MSVPVIQQTTKSLTTTATFPNANGTGNGIIVAVVVTSGTGTVTGISVTDNNGNTYSPVSALLTNKSDGWRTFACTNLKATPNAKITITVTGTSTSGSLTGTSIVAGEWNNTSDMNIVAAFTFSALNGTSTRLSGQPAGTTAVGISITNDTSNAGMSGPPSWTFQVSETFGVPAGLTIADSENFSAGFVTFRDVGTGTAPVQVILIILATFVTNLVNQSHSIDADIQADSLPVHGLDAFITVSAVDRQSSHSADAYIYQFQVGTLVRTVKFQPTLTRTVPFEPIVQRKSAFQPALTRTVSDG